MVNINGKVCTTANLNHELFVAQLEAMVKVTMPHLTFTRMDAVRMALIIIDYTIVINEKREVPAEPLDYFTYCAHKALHDRAFKHDELSKIVQQGRTLYMIIDAME